MRKKTKFADIKGTSEEILDFESLFGHEKKCEIAPSGAILLLENLNGVKNGVSFKEFRELCMAKRKTKRFKDPKIIKCKSGDWYVQYFFRDPKTLKWVPKKTRGGINYIKDPIEKLKEAKILCEQVLTWLKAGNSPFHPDILVEQKIEQKRKDVDKIKEQSSVWSLDKAIAEYKVYMHEAHLSVTTIRTYNKYIASFETWLIKQGLTNNKAAAFTEMDALEFLTESNRVNKWSPTTYNNYKTFIVTFFARSLKIEKTKTKKRSLQYDFQSEYLEDKAANPQRNKSFNDVQFAGVKEQIEMLTIEVDKPGYKNLGDYLEWIFLSLMRPAEIRELKVKDIDPGNRQIRIIGKTGDRLIPISDQLLSLIKRRGLFKANQNNFVFGYMGNVDARRMSVAYFLEKFSVIRKKLKLDENYGPYSFKPTGVIRMIKAGFSDAEIMVLTGHKTQKAFNAYKRDLIIDNSHAMKGSTINF